MDDKAVHKMNEVEQVLRESKTKYLVSRSKRIARIAETVKFKISWQAQRVLYQAGLQLIFRPFRKCPCMNMTPTF